VLALVLALGSAETARGDEDGAEEVVEARVALVSPETDDEATGSLARALEAHLNALPVVFEVVEAATPPIPEILNEVTAAIWMGEDGESLLVLIPEIDAAPRRVVADEEPGTPIWFTALAAIVYSDISAVIPEPIREEELPPPAEEPPLPAEEEPPPVPKRVTVVTVRPGRFVVPEPLPVWLGLLAAYAPSWPIENASVQHGTRLGLALWFARYAEIDLGVELLPSFEIDHPEEDARLKRWPLRLFARGLLPLGRFRLTAGVGLLVEISEVSGVGGHLEDGDAGELQAVAGAALAVGARYWPLNWLGITVDGGLDLAADEFRYTFGDQTLVRVRILRPSVSAGLAFRFPLHGGRR